MVKVVVRCAPSVSGNQVSAAKLRFTPEGQFPQHRIEVRKILGTGVCYIQAGTLSTFRAEWRSTVSGAASRGHRSRRSAVLLVIVFCLYDDRRASAIGAVVLPKVILMPGGPTVACPAFRTGLDTRSLLNPTAF